MWVALAFTAGSFGSFLLMAFGASQIAQRHHYYEDPDEDAQGRHHAGYP